MQMTITRALAELKLLDKKINKNIKETKFIATAVGNKPVVNYKSNADFISQAQAGYQSILDLIAQRDKIKSSIVDSNAKTIVEISGKSMTVATAIEKKSSIEYNQFLLAQLKNQLASANNTVESNNDKMQDKLDKILEASFGKDGKVKDNDMDAITKPYKEQNETKLIDGINIQDKIDKLYEEVNGFITEVDFVLSTSNSTTYIEV